MLKFFEKISDNNFFYLFYYVVITFFFSFFISIILNYFFIKLLKKLKFNQSIKKDIPKSHLKKIGVPNIGGLLIIINIILTTLLFSNLNSLYILYIFFILISYGCIGFIDDYKKNFSKKKKD